VGNWDSWRFEREFAFEWRRRFEVTIGIEFVGRGFISMEIFFSRREPPIGHGIHSASRPSFFGIFQFPTKQGPAYLKNRVQSPGILL
jgi:hypothetical protein